MTELDTDPAAELLQDTEFWMLTAAAGSVFLGLISLLWWIG